MAKSNPSSSPPEARHAHNTIEPARRSKRAWGALAFWFVLTVLLLVPAPVRQDNNPELTPITEVRAPDRIVVPDLETMAVKKRAVEEGYARFWAFRPEAGEAALERLRLCFEAIAQREPTNGTEIKEIADGIYEKSGIRLGSEDLTLLYKTLNAGQFRQELETIVRRMMGSRLIVADRVAFQSQRARIVLKGVPQEILARSPNPVPVEWPAEVRVLLSEEEMRRFHPKASESVEAGLGVKILTQIVGPNLEFDQVATDQTRTARLLSIDTNPDERIYDKGQQIIAAGESPTATQTRAISEAYRIRSEAYPYQVAGVILLAGFCFAGVALFLRQARKDLSFRASTIAMICLPVLIALATGRALTLLEGLNIAEGVSTYLFPMALVGMLSAIMTGTAAGFAMIIATALLFGVAMQADFDFFVLSLFTGFAAIISLRTIRERKDVLEAGLRVGFVSMGTILFLSLFNYPPIPGDVGPLLGGFMNGLFCAAATLPLVVIFERSFGVVTDIRLLELTGPHHELIRRMEERAPGSYQHVLNVTKLAEAGAEAIGANFLLTRAGAYFHDVGKMIKPKYFSENQVTLDDKKAHSRLTPYMSVLIIKNHVKEGIEIAREAGLPEKIIDFIPQHHGTSLIRYFYSEALQRYEETDRVDPVREEDFRYPGPKPQSVEAGIVMLADSVEAIVTSVFTASQVNENDLRRTVGQAVTDRFNDGQFDECDLTMRDLFLIREAFVKTLKARFHQRIAYPALKRAETAREAPASLAQAGVAQG